MKHLKKLRYAINLVYEKLSDHGKVTSPAARPTPTSDGILTYGVISTVQLTCVIKITRTCQVHSAAPGTAALNFACLRVSPTYMWFSFFFACDGG